MGFQWLQDGLFIADTNYYGILHLDSTRTGWFSSRGIEEFGLHPVCRGPYGGNEFPEDLYRLALILHALSNSGRKLRAFAVPSEAGKGWLSWELVFSCHLRVRRSFMRTLLPVSLSLCFRGARYYSARLAGMRFIYMLRSLKVFYLSAYAYTHTFRTLKGVLGLCN